MITTAVILAGGVGSRIQGVEPGLPKPMISIGGKPVLHHQVELLAEQGVREIYFLLNYLPETIENYFSTKQWDGLQLKFIRETAPLGTAGGLSLLCSDLRSDFFVLYGDVMMNLDLQRLAQFHSKSEAIATLVTHPNDHPYDSDLVKIDSSKKILQLLPKKGRSPDLLYDNIVNAALYVFSPQIFKYVTPEKADLFHDIFPKLLSHNESLAAYQTFEYLKDMGTPDRLELVRNQYESGIIQGRTRRRKQKAIFFDRDGTLNDTDNLVYRLEQFELYPFAAEAIRKVNKSSFLSVCLTNQPVIARNLCSIEELETIHRKMATLLGRNGAYLDGLYYCPHHPDRGFPEERVEFKVKCQCRKPARGMVDTAIEDFNIDLSASWVIGDRTADIQLALECGMKAILVETGDAGRDAKYNITPHFRTPDVAKAVDIVLNY